MHDIKIIRTNPNLFKKKISERNADIDFNKLIDLDKNNRELIQNKEKLEQEKKIISQKKDKTQFEKSKELSRIIVKCANTLEKAVGLLHSRGSKLQDILPLTAEINTFENQADQVSSAAMAELFNEEVSPIYVLKWKEVYTLLEGATDFCEDAANMLEGIVLKHA